MSVFPTSPATGRGTGPPARPTRPPGHHAARRGAGDARPIVARGPPGASRDSQGAPEHQRGNHHGPRHQTRGRGGQSSHRAPPPGRAPGGPDRGAGINPRRTTEGPPPSRHGPLWGSGLGAGGRAPPAKPGRGHGRGYRAQRRPEAAAAGPAAPGGEGRNGGPGRALIPRYPPSMCGGVFPTGPPTPGLSLA